jgi:hypothetical protein
MADVRCAWCAKLFKSEHGGWQTGTVWVCSMICGKSLHRFWEKRNAY